MTMGRPNITRAALAALLILSSPLLSRAIMAPAFGDVIFNRASLTIETANGPVPLDVEIADTDSKREQGLMFRRSLAENQGMIFLFGREREITMWMKNTFIPLDMVFIGDDWRVVSIAQNAEPFSIDVISSRRPASRVLEIGAGQARKLGLKVGDRVSLKK
ncbi:DUF192 domain-containing protein [Rhodomicrobium sp. Az07]|nr:DUF192 domain-containing protein [Rhodomicrobium sp. Az07]